MCVCVCVYKGTEGKREKRGNENEPFLDYLSFFYLSPPYIYIYIYI